MPGKDLMASGNVLFFGRGNIVKEVYATQRATSCVQTGLLEYNKPFEDIISFWDGSNKLGDHV